MKALKTLASSLISGAVFGAVRELLTVACSGIKDEVLEADATLGNFIEITVIRASILGAGSVLVSTVASSTLALMME